MLVLGKSRLLLPLLLLLPHNSQGMDGCEKRDEWRCGDKCIYFIAECSCGGETIKYSEAKFCCASNCTSDGICANGSALNLTQSCNGSCNYYGDDENRHWRRSRSHVAACGDTTTCIKEGEGKSSYYKPTICTGDSSCEGELAWCKKEERKEEKCPSLFTRCSPSLGGSKKKRGNGIPGQCIKETKANDETIFHCIDRTDENSFKAAVNETTRKRRSTSEN